MEIGEWIVIGLSVTLMAWFIIGTAYNNRITEQETLRYRGLLKPYGVFGATRRLDPSSVSFSLLEPAESSPLARLEVTISLARRENLPLFLVQSLRGRRDQLILKAAQKYPPRVEIHALPISAGALQASVTSAGKGPLMALRDVGSLRLYHRGQLPEAAAERLAAWLTEHKGAVTRLSIQPALPHLVCGIPLKALKTDPLPEMLTQLLAAIQPGG
jgi:hypothetical protein